MLLQETHFKLKVIEKLNVNGYEKYSMYILNKSKQKKNWCSYTNIRQNRCLSSGCCNKNIIDWLV